MLRLLLSPRWLVRHVLAVVLVVTMGWLGIWQFERARDTGEPPDDPAPVALTSLAESRRDIPAEAAGRQVTVQGRYDPEHQLLVPGKELGGRTGYWVLTPVVLDNGIGVSVVRGWVAEPDDPALEVPGGDVTVTGRLQPSESPDAVPGGALPEGQVAAVNTGLLASQIPYDLYAGFVVLTEQAPTSPGAPALVPAHGPAGEGSSLSLQNLAYAAQWWAFSGFVVFMWWRLLREERRSMVPVAGTDGSGVDSQPADLAR